MSLVIDDSHINAIKEYVVSQCETIDDIIYLYIREMNSVIETGIMEGTTADALKEFLNQVESDLETNIATPDIIGDQTATFCRRFLQTVDKADKELY